MIKILKIGLPIVVIAVLGFFVWKWISGPGIYPPPHPEPPTQKSAFVDSVEAEIEAIKNMPDNKFCQPYYTSIKEEIAYNHNRGYFSDNATYNDQWNEILGRNLHSAYSDKLVEQAMFVFNGNEWKNADLNFIRSEVKTLKQSPYFNNGTVFDKVDRTLNKYDEVSAFIKKCKDFNFTVYRIYAHFPDKSHDMARAKDLKSNMGLVKNCKRLVDKLDSVPQIFFDKHVNYIKEKIAENGGNYDNYNDYNDYTDRVTEKLKEDIKGIDCSKYGVGDTCTKKRSELNKDIDTDNKNAYKHFS